MNQCDGIHCPHYNGTKSFDLGIVFCGLVHNKPTDSRMCPAKQMKLEGV